MEAASSQFDQQVRSHPAPFPVEIAYRLVRMFSFVGDTILDPFVGSGTTTVAAMKCQRNSIGLDIEQSYLDKAKRRAMKESSGLFRSIELVVEQAASCEAI